VQLLSLVLIDVTETRQGEGAMNETMVTLQGWVGGDVVSRPAGDSVVTNFRVASTPRRYQKKTGEWMDGDTQWYSVSAWRTLAENCAASLRRGDPVVVHGRLNASLWKNSAGIEVTSFEVEASFVGHDLNRGTSVFTRPPRVLAPTDQVPEGTESAEAPDSALLVDRDGVEVTAA